MFLDTSRFELIMGKRYYDKFEDLYLTRAIEHSKIQNVLIIEADDIRDNVTDKFMDLEVEHYRTMGYTRLFEIMIDNCCLNGNSYCIEVLRKNKQVSDLYYLFAEDSKNCLVFSNWDGMVEVLDNLPYMNVYITDKDLGYVIAVTQEDNMVYTGIEFVI